MSGKSTMMLEIISQRDICFEKPMGRIYYCYGTYSKQYDNIKDQLGDSIIFISGLPTEENVKTWTALSTDRPIILILDDLLERLSNDISMQTLVTKLCHHCEL
jgi:hypothetical protein